ncbi:MAG: hypothetical protein D4R64_09000 [Porphyromonadaceae bacterium]|nr:MAG: hypothetical protein D4R64_09000 [Porphyromonadaceae bacterium]
MNQNIRKILIIVILISGFYLVRSCKKEDSVLSPVIHATLSPTSGNTTQKFNFDLSRSESRTGRGPKVFTRWDWDGDGSWDTPFTRLLVYEHRYYAPGSWNPRLEMSNLDGATDTLSFTIPVTRGYSPPKPVFIITPDKGHIFTRFLLDASATRDDEDSLDQLSFRWDFEGDGQWDTSFGDSVKITHQYPEADFYKPKIQVRDPSGLISTDQGQIKVTLEDPRLHVSFRCIPDSVTNNTPITMDASASSDLDYPEKPLLYRWDWNSDRAWDTGWLSDPQTIHIFKEEYIHFVRLQVRSFRGLTNETTLKIRVYHRNQPPSASFSVSTLSGNVNTRFRFDCWSTRDVESAPSEMFYRWDFDGDGLWDTDFLNEVITMHQFDTPGTYKTLLQVKDPHGGQDTCSKVIQISHGTNQTGIYQDKRGTNYESYGTVLIGDQWWFTRNMSVHDTLKYRQYFYNYDWHIYYDYGNLYLQQYLTNICPPGWRVPSREDWNKLFSNYPADQLYEALMPGGESDFSAILGGMGTGSQANTAEYQGIYRYGYYWSTTKPLGSSSPSVWVITFDKPKRQVLKGYYDETLKQYSVRCVKDAN